MPEIQAFRGLRYDLGHVGSLSDVVAPPYDVIGQPLQDELYKKHPANVIRLILNRDEPGDDVTNESLLAGRPVSEKLAQRGGAVQRSRTPRSMSIIRCSTAGGQTFTRRGFMARARLERFGEGKIFPHEETMAGPKQDRLLLTRACKANLSQIFGLYPDPAGAVQDQLETGIAGVAPLEAVDHLGVVHRLWPVIDVGAISSVAGLMSDKATFIADGHHRYETACNYRDELIAANGPLASQHPANFVLMMCIGMSDPGLLVLPTHRLFRGPDGLTSERAGQTAGRRVCHCGRQAKGAKQRLTFGRKSRRPTNRGLSACSPTRTIAGHLPRSHLPDGPKWPSSLQSTAADWQGLGVSILHRLVVENLLGGGDWPKPRYVHLVDEVVEGLASGEFPLAALVMPATVDHIRSISEHGERMPAKSTYFYPKLLSGLVINPLE